MKTQTKQTLAARVAQYELALDDIKETIDQINDGLLNAVDAVDVISDTLHRVGFHPDDDETDALE